MDENYLTVLDWPAKSPDLNPIENLWGIIVRHVYANGRQYGNATDLKRETSICWSDIG